MSEGISGAGKWIRRQVSYCWACRECESHVKFTDKVCETCGAGDPVQIPMMHVAMVAALSVLSIALIS